MKIGIAADKRDENFFNSFEILPTEVILYDTFLPPQVTRSLELVGDQMPHMKDKVLIANQSEQGHGNDYGLVFRYGIFDEVELMDGRDGTTFAKNNLVARISMGMPAETIHIGNREVKCKDPSNLSRLHLNVFGARNYLLDKSEGKISESFKYGIEKIHFSLRWLDGKFDNSWNDLPEWIAQKDSRYLSKPQFNPMRTTYYESTTRQDQANGNISRGNLTLKEIQDRIGIDREAILPAELTSTEFCNMFPAGCAIEDIYRASGLRILDERKDYPTIGYAPALKILSRFGKVSEKESLSIPEMNMDEGVEYIFGKILPAMKKFVKS